jgi:hypothetical protein
MKIPFNPFALIGAALTQSTAPTGGGPRQPGPGVTRAKERLAAKLEANKAIPDAEVMTRQRRRQAARAAVKAHLSEAKKQALKGKQRGGAAGVR